VSAAYPDDTPCVCCGHPAGHHDAGECWTDANGYEVWDNRDCDCPGFEADR